MEKNPVVTFYPNRARLTRVLLVHVFMIVALILALMFRDSMGYRDLLAYLFAALITPWIFSYCVGEFYRLVHWTPTLIVDDEGIIDNGSCIVCGVGRIRWEDMGALVSSEDYNEYRGGPRLFGPYLAIYLRDRDAFIGDLPRKIRFLRVMRRFMDWERSDVSIPQFMLDDAVPGIMSDIRGRYEHLRHERHTSARHSPHVQMPY